MILLPDLYIHYIVSSCEGSYYNDKHSVDAVAITDAYHNHRTFICLQIYIVSSCEGSYNDKPSVGTIAIMHV